MPLIEEGLQSKHDYLQILSQGIEQAWLDQDFTDVEVLVDSSAYRCHRMVLSSMSPYFSAMFRSGMKESIAGSVHLQNIDRETFEAVLRFVYTGGNVLTKDNVESLLEAAVMLQIRCLQDQCETFLEKCIGPDNCLGIWRLATNLSCSDLAKKAWVYILEFFTNVVNSEEFPHILIEDLLKIIDDNDLNTPSEEAVCDAVLKWVNSDLENRSDELSKLLRHIRFPLISEEYVKKLESEKGIQASKECQKILQDLMLCDAENKLHGVSSRPVPHRQEEMICVVGTRSRQPNPQATEIKCFSFRRDAEHNLAELPGEPGACFAVCKWNHDVYVSGGYHGQTLFLQFKSSENRWQHCSPLLEGRWGHAMAGVIDHIYILGGCTQISQTLSSIECYDPKLNEIKQVGGLQIPVSFMPIAVLGNRIYVFGGKMQDRTLSTKIQCFDTKKNSCFIIDDMPLVACTTSRVAVLDKTVYIFYRHGDIMTYKEGSSAKVVGNMPHFDHFGVIPHQGHILIVGSQSNQFSTVMFNPNTQEMVNHQRTVKANLCNFYCLPIVMSKQHMRNDEAHTYANGS